MYQKKNNILKKTVLSNFKNKIDFETIRVIALGCGLILLCLIFIPSYNKKL